MAHSIAASGCREHARFFDLVHAGWIVFMGNGHRIRYWVEIGRFGLATKLENGEAAVRSPGSAVKYYEPIRDVKHGFLYMLKRRWIHSIAACCFRMGIQRISKATYFQ
ncbi:hypothetical protein GXP70_14485 [Paenibacillus lycopersici]|uniref:Uncharacterized protein n=1 Tax=Paenibacillus lycopersici TaxID=2704462 RepID=A0A6C0G340_9BACL|nr:hypothetical protein [Paenibacillus lycopersici]QHT61040.1 hypothetical protein GXP70_14485 [Paenibacillus lycopersici]